MKLVIYKVEIDTEKFEPELLIAAIDSACEDLLKFQTDEELYAANVGKVVKLLLIRKELVEMESE